MTVLSLAATCSTLRRHCPMLLQEHISEVAASTGLGGRDGLFKLAAATYKYRGAMDASVDEDYPGALDTLIADVRAQEQAGGAAAAAAAATVVDTSAADVKGVKQPSTLSARVRKGKREAAQGPRTMREEIDAW
jgi:hypothetical protein